jgi:hypothetical protein
MVDGSFYCHNNKIWAFIGAPRHVGDNFGCENSPIGEIWNLFKTYRDIDWLNDYRAIRMGSDGEPEVLLYRLNSFLSEIDKPEISELKNIQEVTKKSNSFMRKAIISFAFDEEFEICNQFT